MNKSIIIPILIFLFACTLGTGMAEVKKASIPNVNVTPNLKSVMSRKDKSRADEEGINTNGYILDEGNIAVDNLMDPKCIFYGNYNDGSGDANQSFNIDTIIFECE